MHADIQQPCSVSSSSQCSLPSRPPSDRQDDPVQGLDARRQGLRPEPTVVDPNDPKGKQQAIHKAESFAEYLAKRGTAGDAGVATAPAEAAPAAAAPAAAGGVSGEWDGIWGFDRQKEIFLAWDPESPRTYTNFNPFERNLDGAKCDSNGCFPGESRGYQPPNRPDVNWQIMQEEKLKLDELKQHPNWGLSGKPGCYSLASGSHLDVVSSISREHGSRQL